MMATVRTRVLLYIALWALVLFILPGVVMSFVYRRQVRQQSASFARAGDAKTPVVPDWVPVRPDFQVVDVFRNGASGSITLRATDDLDGVIDYFQSQLMRSGFQVSSNIMQRDGRVSSVILNAPHKDNIRAMLVSLIRMEDNTRIELTYSEKQ